MGEVSHHLAVENRSAEATTDVISNEQSISKQRDQLVHESKWILCSTNNGIRRTLLEEAHSQFTASYHIAYDEEAAMATDNDEDTGLTKVPHGGFLEVLCR